MRRLSLLALAAFIPFAAAAAEDGPIKIGIVGDQSGFNAEVTGPGAVAAARMAVEDVGGSVLGRKIEILVGDYQGKADTAAGIVRQWIDVDGISAVADGANSAAAAMIQTLVQERNKVFLNTSGSSSDLTGKMCTETAFQWLPDTYSVTATLAKTIVGQGGKTWFFLTSDYSFGHAIKRDASEAVVAAGGTVLGEVLHPFSNLDFSSYLLQAMNSKAQVLALANAGDDAQNSIKQAMEFGIPASGTTIAALQFYITNVQSMGLEATKGLMFMTSVYWDMNDETRAWTKRFIAHHKAIPPSRTQASAYSAVLHYLKAVAKAGTTDGKTVAATMRSMPVDDVWFKGATIREDGRVMYDMYLMQVKTPAESKYPMDYLKILKRVPAVEAFKTLDKSECPLVKHKS